MTKCTASTASKLFLEKHLFSRTICLKSKMKEGTTMSQDLLNNWKLTCSQCQSDSWLPEIQSLEQPDCQPLKSNSVLHCHPELAQSHFSCSACRAVILAAILPHALSSTQTDLSS